MAKADGPGFVDKHIEKVVLLLCLLTLVYTLSQYGVSSQRTYEIADKQNVSPKKIDMELLDAARKLDDDVKDQKVPEYKPRNVPAVLEKLQNDPLPVTQSAHGVQGVEKLTLPFGMPSQPQLSGLDIKGPSPPPPLAKFIETMPAPARPQCWFGTELMVYEVLGPDGEPEIKIEEPPTWRAVSWYPWKKLEAAWKTLLDPTIIKHELVALGYETEIQIKQSDGSWKSAEDVKPVLLPIYDARTGEIIQPPPIPQYTGANGDIVWEWLRQFGEGWTSYQLQPEYYEVWIRNGDDLSWKAHFPFDILNIYPLNETDAATPDTTEKKPLPPSRRGTLIDRLRTARKTAPARGTRDTRDTRDTRGTRGTRGISDTRRLPPMPEDMMPPDDMFMPPGRATPGYTSRTGRRTTPRPSVDRTKTREALTKKAEEEPVVEELPEIPDYETQMQKGKILLWFHVNNIQIGREYRCRFRMVFANPLLTYEKDVEEENRRDAYVPSVRTKWSEWSEPVCVKRDVEFFVTGAMPRKSITVTVFTKWMDQCLKDSISRITPGQRIRGSWKKKVLNPVTGELMKDEDGQDFTIDFDTGAVAIKFDFDQRIQTGPDHEQDDVELIYLDPEGQLRSRSLYRDCRSEKYKELKAEADEVDAMFRPERPVRPVKKTRETKQRLTLPNFGDPKAPPPGVTAPGTVGPFEVNTKTRDSSSKSDSRRSGRSSRSSSRDHD
jgi:hypothetical protein